MKEGYVDIQGIPTKVMCWGKWIEDDNKDLDEVILCIPGNPGVCQFYTLFMETLHKKTGRIAWVLGHAGHSEPSDGCIKFEGKEEDCGLQGQVDHKVVHT